MVNGIINACQPNRNLRNLHGSGSDPVRLPILLGDSETSSRVITWAQANASRAAFLHIPTMKVACCQYIANILVIMVVSLTTLKRTSGTPKLQRQNVKRTSLLGQI